MKVQMIDLKEFFDDKYRSLKNKGIGATGIITQKQMVTRKNSPEMDYDIDKNVEGLGSHNENKIAIIRDIFNLPDILDNGLGYFDPDIVALDMTDEYKNMFNEVIDVFYTNSEAGNKIVIFLPKKQNSITKEQIDAVRYMGECIRKTAETNNIEIEVYASDGNTYVEEINSTEEKIIPYLERYLDNYYKMSMEDQNIIATEDVKSIENSFYR
jgi:hypothetical protein